MNELFMDFPITKPIIALVGPTAVGKTEISLSLAEKFHCEIIGLDSMQIYRYMDVGTAKATVSERMRVAHHLIDIINPDQTYDANCYGVDALTAITDIHSRDKIPLLTGGTGLYLRTVLDGIFDNVGEFPEIRDELKKRLETEGAVQLHEELRLVDRSSAQRIHKNDTHRLIRALEIYHGTGIPWSDHIASHSENKNDRFTRVLKLGLTCDRDKLYERINARTSRMLHEGLQQEVENLLNRGYHRDLKPMKSIGYRHMVQHLLDGYSLSETERLLARDTRRYAKRQYTWFKKMAVKWFETTCNDMIFQTIDTFLNDSSFRS